MTKDGVTEGVYNWAIVVRRYWQVHHRVPNFLRPRTFNEKLAHRILFDRRPILTQLADKAAVRSYVEARLGPRALPKLLHLTNQPETIPFDDLPEKFVVKPTHGWGWVQIVNDKRAVDRSAVLAVCEGWLQRSFYEITREWPYKLIKPQILVEEFLDDGIGSPPDDYKLFVFDGIVRLIQVDRGRFTKHRRRLFSPDWEKLEVLYGYEDIVGEVPAPARLKEMIAAAETLGKDLDFVRADFYDIAGRLYFGEVTTTPECAMGVFTPVEFDRYLGSFWHLPPKSLLVLHGKTNHLPR